MPDEAPSSPWVSIQAALRARWQVCVGVLIGGPLIAGLATLFISPVYSSRTVIYVGQMARVVASQADANSQTTELLADSIEDGQTVAERLRQKHGRFEDHGLPRIESTRVLGRKGPTVLVELVAYAGTAEESRVFLQGVVDQLMKTHGAILQAAREALVTERDRLQNSLKQVEEDAARFRKLLERDSPPHDPLTTMALLERSRRLSETNMIRSQLTQTNLALGEAVMRPTRLVVGPVPSPYPAVPDRMLAVGLGTAAGLAFALLLLLAPVNRPAN